MCETVLAFQALALDTAPIGLARDEERLYFCTPRDMTIIGWEPEGIHYGFIHGFGEMVFVVNPMTCCDQYVYPLANTFSDFLRLVLAAKGTTPLAQIILWERREYQDFINAPEEIAHASQPEVVQVLSAIQGLGLTPMEDPFAYVKTLQREFDYSRIPFRDEYYDLTGLETPS